MPDESLTNQKRQTDSDCDMLFKRLINVANDAENRQAESPYGTRKEKCNNQQTATLLKNQGIVSQLMGLCYSRLHIPHNYFTKGVIGQ